MSKKGTRYKLTNATMAMLLLSAEKGELPNNTYALSEKIYEMKNKGIDAGNIFLSLTAGGYYCEQLEQFLGCAQIAGNAIGRNPTKLAESGINCYKEIIQKACQEYPAEIEDIAKYLKISEII